MEYGNSNFQVHKLSILILKLLKQTATMYNTKVLLPVAALAGMSLAETLPPASCSSIVSSFIAGAPTFPADIAPILSSALSNPAATATTTLPPDTLADPEGYVELLCSVAGELPSSLLPEFQSWGQGLLKYGSSHISAYDDFVTQCVTTGEAAATITSYLNSILTGGGALCAPTATPGASSNGTTSAAITPAPTATGSNSTATASSTSVVTAAAARPTGAFVGAAAIGGLLGAVALL
ncbi:hypothetical protein F5Y10DRAFT_256627 [Nemania abortiva]|nr:hypothetical protein F5Y10DRAFT_256627 [Nemania abortiva]